MFPSQGYLNRHIKETHENPESYECEICGMKFNLKKNIQKHQKTHDRNRPKPYKCHRCNYATDVKGNLKTHEKMHGNQDKKFAAMKNPVKCEKCQAFFKNSSLLKHHVKYVHPKHSFQCDLCGNYIKIKGNLIRHIKERICLKNSKY